MKKKFLLLPSFVLLCVFGSYLNAASRIMPGDVVGRDLEILGLGWAGHVGVMTAQNAWDDGEFVLEVLKDPPPVIQLNFLVDFKTMSPYWGSRYGIANRAASTFKLLREGEFQKDLHCAVYTKTSGYKPGVGYYDPLGKEVCSSYGQFRCDTFVYYLFRFAGYDLGIKHAILPRLVFKAFPYAHRDGLFTRKSNEEGEIVPSGKAAMVSNLTSEQWIELTDEAFLNVIDVPDKNLSESILKNLFNLARACICFGYS
jgi:hypothetical protein